MGRLGEFFGQKKTIGSGKAALEWSTEHLLEKIRYYLCDTDLSIKQICDLLDFANPSFFG